jgi:hypothetical protein
MRNDAMMIRRGLAVALTLGLTLALGAGPAQADYQPGVPPAVDPGTPVFAGAENPMPPEPVPFDPTRNMLGRVFDADVAGGATSYWFDRVLARPFLSNQDSYLYTRGRALYMYTHNAAPLGFAGGFAYRERPTDANQSLYTVAVSDATLTESTSERTQYPSHWSSVHTAEGLRVAQRKFITYDNVAVTVLTVTNTGAAATQRTLTVSSPVATTASASNPSELTGSVTARYATTVVTPRLSGDEMAVSGTTLTRTLALEPGQAVTLKVQLGATTAELSNSNAEYERYRGLDAETAWRTHVGEYNRWWVENVPYIDIPNDNVKKMSYYRTFLSRYNYIDANIPGNDYQFPVSIEGVLGYNNAIQLTQPMHLQDLKYFRNPLYSYGNWVSSGETSKCTAFTSNPGSFSWGNTYEQYIAREAWNAFKVHGGDRAVIANFARYAECDIKGQLAKYDRGNGNSLIEYASGALTGNDADAVALQYFTSAISQDRTETAFWYSGAKAAAEAYTILGDTAKATEMNTIAENIRTAILTLLWDDTPADSVPTPTPSTRVAGQAGYGNAVGLNGPHPNQSVTMPAGIIGTLNDFTVATWVNLAATTQWSRVFDFGSGPTMNMFLTVNAGTGPRFAITTAGGGNEQRINPTVAGQLPTNQWIHLAVTLAGNTGTLYVNGAPVGTNANITLRPSSMGNTTQNWIGKSQYGDPGLNGTVDEFGIYDRALSEAEVQALMAAPGGPAGQVARYAFDETGGATAVDSSGNGRDARVDTPLVGHPGKVFKQRNVSRNALVPWKDQQNFSPFTEGLVPNTDEYKQALRYYADRREFPIMPFYTANQRDKAEAATGSNNFSNINSTLQAQLYAKALREYPSPHITADMYRLLLEWLTWVQYVGGDNRYPDNNEFFFNWNPATQTLGRSGIHHNILGAYNFMIIDDIAGVRPRLDDVVELWPIDVGYDHFAVNNLSYHGRDLTVVWDKPGDGRRYYPTAPEGYTVYLAGKRAFTVDDLAHVSWNARTGAVSILDGSDTRVVAKAARELPSATDIGLSDNGRVVDMFAKAGVDLTLESGWLPNLARGKAVTASFTTMTPNVRATAPENAVDGFTYSGLPIQQGTYVARNTIWGTQGSPNAQDWLEVDLGAPTTFNTVKLYFFSDKAYQTQSNGSGNTYRQPSAYTLQYHNGTDWVDVPDQVKSPAAPQPNLNTVTFAPLTAQRFRLLVTPVAGFGVGVKEVQIFEAVRCDRTVSGLHVGSINVTDGVTCLAEGALVIGAVRVAAGAGLVATGAVVIGPVTATGARLVESFGSTFVGPVSISGTTVRVALSGSRLAGPVSLAGNATGATPIVVTDNDVLGLLSCSGNTPAPVNYGRPNSVTGVASGQCARL